MFRSISDDHRLLGGTIRWHSLWCYIYSTEEEEGHLGFLGVRRELTGGLKTGEMLHGLSPGSIRMTKISSQCGFSTSVINSSHPQAYYRLWANRMILLDLTCNVSFFVLCLYIKQETGFMNIKRDWIQQRNPNTAFFVCFVRIQCVMCHMAVLVL